jgi:hypothetical protein
MDYAKFYQEFCNAVVTHCSKKGHIQALLAYESGMRASYLNYVISQAQDTNLITFFNIYKAMGGKPELIFQGLQNTA